MVFAVTNTDSADIPGLMMATPASFRGKPHHEKRSWKKKHDERGGGRDGERRERSDRGPRPPKKGGPKKPGKRR